jgi:hypothetical protein
MQRKFGFHYTVTFEDHLKKVSLNANMVLGLFYDALPFAVLMWPQ